MFIEVRFGLGNDDAAWDRLFNSAATASSLLAFIRAACLEETAKHTRDTELQLRREINEATEALMILQQRQSMRGETEDDAADSTCSLARRGPNAVTNPCD